MTEKKYRSHIEISTSTQLSVKWEYEPGYMEYTIPAKKKRYIPDWVNKENKVIIECKGGGPYYGLTEETKEKMLAVKEQWPEYDFRFCFENAKLKTGQGKGKPKITYGEWATKHNFKWCEKVIPDDWK